MLLLVDNIFRFIQAGMEISRDDGPDAVPPWLSANRLDRNSPTERAYRQMPDTGAITSNSGCLRCRPMISPTGGGAYVFQSAQPHRAVAQASSEGSVPGH